MGWSIGKKYGRQYAQRPPEGDRDPRRSLASAPRLGANRIIGASGQALPLTLAVAWQVAPLVENKWRLCLSRTASSTIGSNSGRGRARTGEHCLGRPPVRVGPSTMIEPGR
jgi:hypothetical protein